jgi:hypothetical protein
MLLRSRSARMLAFPLASSRRLAMLVIASSLLFPAIALGQTPQADVALDLPSYKSELERTADALNHPEQMHALRQSLPRTWRVHVDDQILNVSTDWLASGLKKIEDDPANAKSAGHDLAIHLNAMRNAAAALERPSHDSLGAAHEQLDKVLSGREFSSIHGPSQFDLLKDRITRWIGWQIYKLLSRLHLSAKTSNVLAWTIVVIAFLALCYWVWRTLGAAERRRIEAPEQPRMESNDPRQWTRDALAAADRDDYREAVHCAYWAAVVHLETVGVLKRDRSRTPRESLRLLDPHPAEQNLLREFTRRFELIWYGYRPASAQDWSEARSNLEKMGCLTPSIPATANS